MGLILKTLYVYIANLGILVTSIFKSFFGLIFKGLQKLFKFNKESFASAKTFFKRSIAFILLFSGFMESWHVSPCTPDAKP